MTHEEHKKAVEDLNAVLKSKPELAKKILKSLRVEILVFGTNEQKASLRGAFMATAMKETAKLLQDSSNIGKSLAESKIA